jgi:hypothetical protein
MFYFPFVRLSTCSIESAGFVSPLRMTGLALQKKIRANGANEEVL